MEQQTDWPFVEKDQFSQQQLYQAEQARLEGTILQLEDELKQLEELNAYLIQKQETLNEQAQQIDVLFREQQTLIEDIDELISLIQLRQSIKDDSDKQIGLNVKLHAEIRQSFGNLIPETLIQQEEILKYIEEQSNTLMITRMALEKLKLEVEAINQERYKQVIDITLLQILQAK